MNAVCLNPTCPTPPAELGKRNGITRGLCYTCYKVAYDLVKQGAVTWKFLEYSGKSLPSINDRRNSIQAWLTGDSQ